MDVDRIIISRLPPLFLPTILPVWQLFEISAYLKLVLVPFRSLLLDIGHLEKSFPDSIM